MNYKITCLLVAVFVAGCSSGGGDKQKPRDGVKSKIVDAGSNALTGQTAVFETAQSFGGGNGLLSEVVASVGVKAPSESRKATNVKSGRIRNVLMNGKCQIESAQPKNRFKSVPGIAGNFPQMNVTIAGHQCPMEVTLAINIAGNAQDICVDSGNSKICKFAANMNMNYRVIDRQLAEELQVSGGRMNMQFEVEQAMPDERSSSHSGPISIVFKVKNKLVMEALDLNSQAHVLNGTQNFNVSMTFQRTNNPNAAGNMIASISEDIKYNHDASKTSSSFSANVNANGNIAQEQYFIDGISVTGPTYIAEREKFANSLMTPIQNENPNGSTNPGEDNTEVRPNPIPSYP